MLGNRIYWKVFVAHPSDVDKDARVVEQAIEEINEMRPNSIPLKFLSGKTHGVPGVGKQSIEDVIIKSMGEFDIFVGIMWKKFGEPIKFNGKEYKSATEAEFEYALDRKDLHENIDIMFYFSDRSTRDEVNPEQSGLVTKFRDSLREKNVYYHSYKSLSKFKIMLIKHLKLKVEELEKIEKSIIEGTEEKSGTKAQNSAPYELLYEHDENGKRINGDFNRLKDAVTEGCAIRIRVHHPNGTIQVMDAPLLSIENEVVHASDINQISKTRDKSGNYIYQEKSYHYLVIASSNGHFHAKRIFFNGTDRNATTSKRHIAWIGLVSPK
jgi:hypothetical protein